MWQHVVAHHSLPSTLSVLQTRPCWSNNWNLNLHGRPNKQQLTQPCHSFWLDIVQWNCCFAQLTGPASGLGGTAGHSMRSTWDTLKRIAFDCGRPVGEQSGAENSMRGPIANSASALLRASCASASASWGLDNSDILCLHQSASSCTAMLAGRLGGGAASLCRSRRASILDIRSFNISASSNCLGVGQGFEDSTSSF